jgi:DNA-binding MarR family transcriptional regulator
MNAIFAMATNLDGAGVRRVPSGSRQQVVETGDDFATILAHATMSVEPTPRVEACAYVVGDDGLTRWSETHADAWIGLLETHKRLTRALDAELEAEHGLTLSGLEVLGRLAAAPGRCLQLSAVATATGLSLSRISRIVDTLCARGLVERRSSRSDARAVDAHLSAAGLTLARAAQATHFASVQERFFDQLGPAELATLAQVFGRFAPRAAEECDADR